MARDKIHNAVKNALEKEGWTINSDPFRLPVEGANLEIDMEAEKFFSAKRGNQKILIEVKSFLQPSILYSFYEAYGQYAMYRDAIKETNLNQDIFLAISIVSYFRIKKVPFLWKRIQKHNIKLIVVNTRKEKIIEWIK